ncbi:hypothetical protein DM02DRAFT_563840, partial [Periconia macrospinosa]
MENTHNDSDKNRQPLRRLLPASGRARQAAPPIPKRARVSNACSACRTRKTKCSAERPKCSKCIFHNTACEYADTERQMLHERYDSLRSEQTAYAELLNKLVTLPEDESFEMLRRLRETNDAGHLPIRAPYPHTDNDASRRYPSPNQTNRNILPPTSTSAEFQLVAIHPNAYPALIPLDVASIDLGLLGISPFTTFLHGKPDSPLRRSEQDFISEHDQQLLSTPSSAGNRGDLAIGTQSGPSSQYIDARLNHIRIRRWTDVAITDDFAARAISLYLKEYSPWFGYFNIDLFLEDLACGETRFCSRLLVNAVLSWACVPYAYYEPAAYSLASSFLHEASQLYDTVKDVDCLPTVAATSLICMALISLGKDKIGMKFLTENASMAERLHLYNVPTDPPPSPLNLQDDDLKTAAATVAWGSFNLQMLMSMSYRIEPLVKLPPSLPIPGDLSAEGLCSRPLPPYQGQAYTSVCKLWSIAFEMNYQYFYGRVVSLAAAERIFQKLLAWADDLQEGVRRNEQNPHGVTPLHIWFHTVVLDLFRPFADLKPQPKLITVAGNKATPTDVIEASITQLKRLVYVYRATCLSANYSVIWQSGMLYLINYILHHHTNKEAHFYFLLCMRGYQNLTRIYPFITGIVQGIAALAVRLGTILPDNALMLFEEIKSEGRFVHEYMTTYPIDLYHSTEDSDTASLEHLIHEFRTMGNLGSEESEVPEGWRGDSASLFTTLLTQEDEAAIT